MEMNFIFPLFKQNGDMSQIREENIFKVIEFLFFQSFKKKSSHLIFFIIRFYLFLTYVTIYIYLLWFIVQPPLKCFKD